MMELFLTLLAIVAGGIIAIVLVEALEYRLTERMWKSRRKRWAFGGYDPAYPKDETKRAAAQKQYEKGRR